jgi:ATP/maltotriose-dependent transcriptional regulator MalT
VGFLEWKAQRRERAQDKADKAELIRLLQESQEQNRAEFQTLKADIKAINQKPEAAQQKARLVSSSIPRSARQSVRLRQRVRDRASRIRVERGRSVCLARGNLGR